MNVESFIDTNVFVYQLERIDIQKANIADNLIEYGIRSQSSCISHQVIQECVNTAVRKAEIPLTGDEMRRYIVDVLAPLYQIRPDIPLYLRSLDIQSRYHFSFYDSLIVAAALTAGCRTLYTEDLSDNQQIEGMTLVNPFRSTISN
ncbi:MAG: PIN domain-containing protein [Gammaproteobacteria bacterium]|nr:PIN domain-containing protein [Gammaproteobacteria bacterium]